MTNTEHNSASYYANRDSVIRTGDDYTNPVTGTVGKVVEVATGEIRVSYPIDDHGMTGSAWYAI